MDFILNNYHRNISDKDLLEDLVEVSYKLDTKTLTMGIYAQYGKYNPSTIWRRFGSWEEALKQAGLKPYKERFNIHNLIKDVKEVAQQLQKTTITISDYRCYGKYKHSFWKKGFGWNDVLKMANLEPTHFRLGKNKKISDEELFEDIANVWIKLGRQPTITDLRNGHFKFSQNTYTRRFGGWRGALTAFINYMNTVEPSNNTIANKKDNETKLRSIEKNHVIIHKTRRDINLAMRFKILTRDKFKCICGRTPATDPTVILHVDHIIPWAKGGETVPENLQTLCSICNLGKSDLTCDEQ